MSTADQVSESLFRGYLDASARQTEMILRILENFLNRTNYTNEDMRGVKTLLEHLQSGGNVNMSSVDLKDSEAIGTILKSMNVPYVCMRDGDTDKCVVITRDTERDRNLTREAFRRFAVDRGADLQQIKIDELLQANENKQIKHADKLTPEQLEVFKERMKNYKGQYAIVRNRQDNKCYDLYYPNKCSREVENALKDMVYDFTGEKGAKYNLDVQTYLNKRSEFAEKLFPGEGETLYLVSKSDPTRFITVTDDGYAIHRAKATAFKGKDGKEHLTMTDKFPIRHSILDRMELMDNIKDFVPDAVLLTEAEMGIVSSVSSNGACLFAPDHEFGAKYQALAGLLNSRKSDMPVSPIRSDFIEKPMLTSYIKLSKEQLDSVVTELKKSGLDRQLAWADDGATFSIAFPEENTKMQGIVDSVLFGGLSELDSINQKMYQEGRAVDDFNKPGFAIFDAASPGATIFTTEKGVSIAGIKDGISDKLTDEQSENREYNRNDPEFGANVAGLIKSMKEPVALKVSEYDLMQTDRERFTQILTARIPSKFDTPAEKEYYKHDTEKDKAIRNEIHKRDNAIDAKDLPQRSQDALKKFEDLEIRDLYVERTFTEKITEMDFADRKMVDRSFMSETTTTSIDR